MSLTLDVAYGLITKLLKNNYKDVSASSLLNRTSARDDDVSRGITETMGVFPPTVTSAPAYLLNIAYL